MAAVAKKVNKITAKKAVAENEEEEEAEQVHKCITIVGQAWNSVTKATTITTVQCSCRYRKVRYVV